MAQVDEPSDTLKSYFSIGKVFACCNLKGYYYIRKLVSPLFVSQKSESLIVNETKFILEEWQDLGEPAYLTGLDLFFRESYKSGLQSIFDVAVFDQNVFMADL